MLQSNIFFKLPTCLIFGVILFTDYFTVNSILHVFLLTLLTAVNCILQPIGLCTLHVLCFVSIGKSLHITRLYKWKYKHVLEVDHYEVFYTLEPLF